MEERVRRGEGGREFSMWAVIRGNQQGGQGGLVGSERSTTKQPFSSLAASLRGASQAYLSSRLLNRLTSGSHPTRTHSHTLSPPWFLRTQRNHDPAAASLTTLTFSLTSRSSATQARPGHLPSAGGGRLPPQLLYMEFCSPVSLVVFIYICICFMQQKQRDLFLCQ